MRVLVVDDDPGMRHLLTRRLSVEGEVVAAASAAEAYALIEHEAYDVVVLDIYMPGETGIELARRIQARWPTIPLVVITGASLDQESLIQECLQAGAESVIFKREFHTFLSELQQTIECVTSAEQSFDRTGSEITKVKEKWHRRRSGQ